jgi:hypothetical protein
MLDSAIAMANAITSKSMHDLDKRHLDEFYEHQPPPQTPNSPAKKFSFWFPGSGAAAANSDRRNFSDESNANANADLSSLLTPGEKDAYRALIEGGGSREAAAAAAKQFEDDDEEQPCRSVCAHWCPSLTIIY